MKILIAAYACEPGQGSEPGVGWNIVREISQYHQVWVFTSNCHRQGIEAYIKQNPLPNIHFVYLDPFGWMIDWSPKGKRTQMWVQLHYYLWQIKAYMVARKLHKEISFDVAHHVTYVRYSSPSFISLLPIPFIWGPVGGGESVPKPFWKNFSLRGKIYEILRYTAHQIGQRDPFVSLTVKNSTLIRATTEDTARQLRQIGASNVEIYSESGLSEEEIEQLAQCPIVDSNPIRFISMARLLHWKGIHLGVQAFAQANLPEDTEYWILGDGPERERLQQLAEELGVANRVKLWGKLSRHETLLKLRECHTLVHPSLHDSGGWVCLEAMAAGRPVICLDLGGPSVQVTEETGFKIPAHTPDQVIQDIAKAMTYLAKDPDLRLHLGQAGQQRVREVFNWKKKAFLLSEIYKKACNHEYQTNINFG